jgi:hypothetical protein
MSTRGLYGFYRDGITKATYNHFDSYPTGLGRQVAEFVLNTTLNEMNHIFDNIIMVDSDTTPTDAQIHECWEFYDPSVSTRKPQEWYALLRQSQGDLNFYKHGLKYMIDSANFIEDSLFCEWAYIINLDTNVLEVYEGFQKEPQHNRYYISEPDNSGYYNCKLVAEIPLNGDILMLMPSIKEED